MTPEQIAAKLTPAHTYRWRRTLGGVERHKTPCRVLARGRMNSILVEFGDGWKAITSRNAVRRIVAAPPQEPARDG